ncbi:MAG: hypothetical protein ACI9R3_003404 [Verrucomicrobiales bacterium]|jgi:hypothetical protein
MVPAMHGLSRIQRPLTICFYWLFLWGTLGSFSICWSQENKITVEIDGITFDSNYDNGSLETVRSVGADLFQAQLFVESGELGERSYWFRFRMHGVAGRSFKLALDHRENRRPFIRIGDAPWRRMTAEESPNTSRVILSFDEDEDAAELAFFEPLGLAETYAAVNQLASGNAFFESEVIGQSFQGKDVVMITVNDVRYPSAGKHRVWLHSRAHAGEVTSTHSMLGFLRQVLDDSELGRRLREHCIFHIVPILNVDGVDLGHTRWDARGMDPERPWCDVNIPVVEGVKKVVDQLMATENPIKVALNLHSTRGTYADTFFFKHLAPSVTPEFELIQQRYIDAFAGATPLFENLDPQTSQLNACLFIESYFWNNWGESVMALTHEGHYGRRITDDEYLTGEDYREMGRGMAVALVDYFGLPEATETDLDYAGWLTLQFDPAQRADNRVSGIAADPDGDGVSNFEEFLVQTEPLSPASVLPPLQILNGEITFTLAARSLVTGLELQNSVNLEDWGAVENSGLEKSLTVAERVERTEVVVKQQGEGDQVYFRLQFAR